MSERRASMAIVSACLAWSCAVRQQPLQVDGAILPISVESAQDADAGYRTEFYAASGLALGLRYHRSYLGGEFDGDSALIGTDVIVVPDADDGNGYEVSVGAISEGAAWEISYTNMRYRGTFGGAPVDTNYESIALNGRFFTRANTAVQPYWLLGILLPWAELENASTDGVIVGDAELTAGLGFNVGLGMSYFLTSHLAIDVRSLYTYQWFSEAEGVSGQAGEISGDLDAPSVGISFGVTWIPGLFQGASR